MTSQKEQKLIWTLEDADHYDEAKIVRSLAQQRAELLEALKDVMSAVELGWIPDGESIFNAREAITKAEAAE